MRQILSRRINPEDLMRAYGIGYFPMAEHRDAEDVLWVLPRARGVLFLDQARAPKKMLRLLRRDPFEVVVNRDFAAVIAACAEEQPDRDETWINPQIIDAYSVLHERGHVHSVECYQDGALVGGLYGVAIGGVFCGESMFSRASNASKVALLHLIARLKLGGFSLLDTQFYTDHLGQFGVDEVENDVYQQHLSAHLHDDADFYRAGSSLSAATVSQSITQIS